jgi:thioredoxin-dependent peroxiredoxin
MRFNAEYCALKSSRNNYSIRKHLMSSIDVNHSAPTFQLVNQSEKLIDLSSFGGQWIILYFYPKDSTPGCTTEAVDFTALLPEFTQLGATVIGISPDSAASHHKFIAKQNLQITLLSDPDHQVAEAYGVWQLKKFMGKEYMGVVRSTFAIDPQGKVAQTWPKVKVKGHAAAVLEWLTAHLAN